MVCRWFRREGLPWGGAERGAGASAARQPFHRALRAGMRRHVGRAEPVLFEEERKGVNCLLC